MKIIARIIILVGLALVAGCAESENGNQASSGESNKANDALRLFIWEDYISAEVLKNFTSRTGIPVVIQTYSNIEEMFSRVRSAPADFDLIVADSQSVEEMAEALLIQKVNSESLTNFHHLSDDFVDKSFDPKNSYSVPFSFGTTVIAFRQDKLPDLEESWRSLEDPRVSGRVSILDEKSECYGAALRSLGYNPNSKDPEELAAASVWLQGLVANNAARIASDMETKELMETGKVWMSMVYSGDAALLADGDERISYFLPNEGTFLWMDNLTISRDCANLDGAHAFINYLLEPEVAALNANELWFATPNETSEEFLNEELLNDDALFPRGETRRKRCEWLFLDQHRDGEMNVGWAKISQAAPL